ncbi:uncharacterized protein si:ch73-43g23.1 [Engraulis encrasicolus]|uniref:uncharacterized protein si:ch73-43g23.1 n=1 Tax=Engraulis encrasicolus TaxID=184585 RepID=UPI002FD0DBBF
MESWVLEGDSYSLISGAPPQPFNLQSRANQVPNRVEIFDITRVCPSVPNVISETTCLCDIFGGEDSDASSLPSSPATALRRAPVAGAGVGEGVRRLEGGAGGTNDSSGSYHTANTSEQRSSDAGDKCEDSKEAVPCTLKSDLKSSGSTAPTDGQGSIKSSQAAESLQSDSVSVPGTVTGLCSKSRDINSSSPAEALQNNASSDSLIYSGGREVNSPELRNTASSPTHKDSAASRGKTQSSQSERSGKSSVQPTLARISEKEEDLSAQDDVRNVEAVIGRKNVCPIPIFSIIPQFRDSPLFFAGQGNTPKLNRVNQVPLYPIIPHLPGNLIAPLLKEEGEDFITQNKSPTVRDIDGQSEATLLSAPQEISGSSDALTASVSEETTTAASAREEPEVDHIETGHTTTSDQLRCSVPLCPIAPYSPIPEEPEVNHIETGPATPSDQLRSSLPSSPTTPCSPIPEEPEENHIETGHTSPLDKVRSSLPSSPVSPCSPIPEEPEENDNETGHTSPSDKQSIPSSPITNIETGHTTPSEQLKGPVASHSPVPETVCSPDPQAVTDPSKSELSSNEPEEVAVACNTTEPSALPERFSPGIREVSHSSESNKEFNNSSSNIEIVDETSVRAESFSSETREVSYSSQLNTESSIYSSNAEIVDESSVLTERFSSESREGLNAYELDTSCNISSSYTEIIEEESSVLTERFSPEARVVLHSPELHTESNISSSSNTVFITKSPELITGSVDPTVVVSSPKEEELPYRHTPEPIVGFTNSPQPPTSSTAYSGDTCSGTEPELTVVLQELEDFSNFSEDLDSFNSPEPELANQFISPERAEICSTPETELASNFASRTPTAEYSSQQSSCLSISPHSTAVANSAELPFVANSPEPKGIHPPFKSTGGASSSQSITVSPEPSVVISPPVPEVYAKLPDNLVIRNSDPILVTITPEPMLTGASAGASPVSSPSDAFKILQSPEPRIISVSPESAFQAAASMFNPDCPSPEIRITYSEEPRTTSSPAENVRMSYSPEARGVSVSPHSVHIASRPTSGRGALTPEMHTGNSGIPSPERTNRTSHRTPNRSPNRTPSPFQSITAPQVMNMPYSIVAFDGRLVEPEELKRLGCSLVQHEAKNTAQSPDRLSIRSPENSSLVADTRNTTPFSELKDICSSPELNPATPEPEPCVSECSLELWSPGSPCAVNDIACFASPEVQSRNLSPEIAAAAHCSSLQSHSTEQRRNSTSPGQMYAGVSPHGLNTSPHSEICHLSPARAKSGTSRSPDVVRDEGQQRSPLPSKSESVSPRVEPDLEDEAQQCTGAPETKQYSHNNQPAKGPSPNSSRQYSSPWQADTKHRKVTETSSESTTHENLSSSTTLAHFETAPELKQEHKQERGGGGWEESERWEPDISERQSVGSSGRAAGQTGLTRSGENPTVTHDVDESGEHDHWPCQDREEYRDREEAEIEGDREGEGEGDEEGEIGHEHKHEGPEQSKASETGEGRRSREAGYRGEQVELSFSARNRRGPASSSSHSQSHSTAPTTTSTRSRAPKPGIPSSSYSEWLVETRQQQQHYQEQQSHSQSHSQTQIRAHALQQQQQQQQQQESKGGAVRRLKSVHNRVHNNNNNPTGSAQGRLPAGYKGENSGSMGSEFDDVDNEVKWLTDQAFSSLSGPQVDYLDMYNSSHRSSTNVSMPSTQDSPGAAAWMSYADLRGSAQGEFDDAVPRQHSYVPPFGDLDPSRRFEMGSFECVDVALESREEVRKGKRTVPKRQIQLKRRDNSGTMEDTDFALDSPSAVRRNKGGLVRQRSTPVSIEEDDMMAEGQEPEPGDRKERMERSPSLEEPSSCKTKIASCLIKNVLSKKMHTNSGTAVRSKDDTSPHEDTNKPLDSITPPPEKEGLRVERASPSQFSDTSVPSVNLSLKEAPSSPKVAPKVPPKPRHYTLPPLPQDVSTSRPEPREHRSSAARRDRTSPLDDPLGGKKIERQRGGKQVANGNPRDKRSSGSRDSANVGVGNTGTAATRASGMPGGMTNRELEQEECHARPENHKQRGGSGSSSSSKSVFMSKTQEIMLKPCTPKVTRKQTSVKVPSSPGLERRTISLSDSEEKAQEDKQFEGSEYSLDAEQMEEDECEISKTKRPMHVVRDVRRLVKNTYSLSFKAAAAATSSSAPSPHDSEPPTPEEPIPLKPAPMQIECKAISNKESKEPQRENDKSARTSLTPVRQESTKSYQPPKASPKIPPRIIELKPSTSEVPIKEANAIARGTDDDTASVTSNQKEEVLSETSGRHPKLGSIPKVPSKDREVSKLVFQPEGSAKGTVPPDAPPSPCLSTAASSHSVSMIMKEKGMQADIGVCEVSVSENTGHSTCKHINRIEVPVQTASVDGTTSTETIRGEGAATIRQSPTASPRLGTGHARPELKPWNSPRLDRRLPKVTFEENRRQGLLSEEVRERSDVASMQVNSVKKAAASPLITRRSQAFTEGKSEGQGNTSTLQKTSKEIELPIQVRSISYDRPKPVLPTKPSCKQPMIEIKSISHDRSKAQTSVDHSQSVEEHTRFEILGAHGETVSKPSPPVHTNKLAVSARSSYRPPPPANKMAAVSSLTQTTAAFESHSNKQLHATAATSTATAATGSAISSFNRPQMPTVSTSKVSGPLGNPGAANMPCTTTAQQQVMQAASSSGSVQTVEPLTVQAPSYTQQLAMSSFANPAHGENVHHFYASDDPPSYDDRESFSPYQLPDLPPRRSNRYHPNSRPPPCSACSANCSSHLPGHGHHPRVSPHARTPPTAPHSPGGSLPYPGVPPQAQVRPHQCRLPGDGQPMSIYKPASPKGPMLNPAQQHQQPPPPSAMYQPHHHPPPNTHPGPMMQSLGDERQPPPPPGQHGDRRGPLHHPPPPQHQQQHQQSQQPPPPQPMAGASGRPYGDHLHSSNMGPMESRPPYLCSPQDLASSYGPEYDDAYGPDGAYGQGPRRVLLDPDTGKYFYIEVPMQPLRKMLFDPETGTYVEVLIPQQALSHSGLYPPPAPPPPPPPPAAPYSSMHGPSMYGPQYLPYPMGPPHPQATHGPPPPRNPEPHVPTTLHQGGMGYGNPGGPVPKSAAELQNQPPPMDPGYLDSMYYIPSGMNASPNSGPSDCYHKPSNMPTSGSRRS